MPFRPLVARLRDTACRQVRRDEPQGNSGSGKGHENSIEDSQSSARNSLYPYDGLPTGHDRPHLASACLRLSHRNEGTKQYKLGAVPASHGIRDLTLIQIPEG